MATTQKSEAEKAPKEAVKEADPKEDEATFSQEYAVSHAFELVGEESNVVAGALSGVTKQKLTSTEIQAAVKKWKGAEVA